MDKWGRQELRLAIVNTIDQSTMPHSNDGWSPPTLEAHYEREVAASSLSFRNYFEIKIFRRLSLTSLRVFKICQLTSIAKALSLYSGNWIWNIQLYFYSSFIGLWPMQCWAAGEYSRISAFLGGNPNRWESDRTSRFWCSRERYHSAKCGTPSSWKDRKAIEVSYYWFAEWKTECVRVLSVLNNIWSRWLPTPEQHLLESNTRIT